MTNARSLRLLIASTALVAVLAVAGPLRPTPPPACAAEAPRCGELIWESLSRHLLPQASFR